MFLSNETQTLDETIIAGYQQQYYSAIVTQIFHNCRLFGYYKVITAGHYLIITRLLHQRLAVTTV